MAYWRGRQEQTARERFDDEYVFLYVPSSLVTPEPTRQHHHRDHTLHIKYNNMLKSTRKVRFHDTTDTHMPSHLMGVCVCRRWHKLFDGGSVWKCCAHSAPHHTAYFAQHRE